MVEFTDKASIEAWARTRSQEEIAVFVGLCAARVWPGVAPSISFNDGTFDDFLSGRAILTALVAGKQLAAAVAQAAERAASAVRVSAGVVSETAYKIDSPRWMVSSDLTFVAADAAIVAIKAGNELDRASDIADIAIAPTIHERVDPELADASARAALVAASILATELETGGVDAALRLPIWPGGIPEPFARSWKQLSDERGATPSIWGFWLDWYQGLLDGRAPDWELWRDIVLIPEPVWQAGPEAVAQAIEGVKLRLNARVVPPLVRHEGSEVFSVAPEPPLPGDVNEFARNRIKQTLANALDSSGSNGLQEDSYEVLAIRRALDDPDSSASVLATAFYDASLGLIRNIGDIYPEEVSLINLKNGLYAAVEEICEHSPDARKRCARLAGLQSPRPVAAAEAADLERMVDIAQEQSDDQLVRLLREDARLIARLRNAPKWVKARFLTYMTTIGDHLDSAKKQDARVTWFIKRVSNLWEWFKNSDLW